MKTEPVATVRMELVDDLEGLPGSSGGCLLALSLDGSGLPLCRRRLVG
ncbi:hypothetical protein [Micromonospora sp. NPDC023633]